MQLWNGYIMGADPFANFAVIAEFEPFRRNVFSLKAETFSIGTGEFRAWKKACGLQHWTIGVADGAFDTLINVGFHRTKCFATEITEGTKERSKNSFF
jgi:hypothetical protein